MAYADLEKRRAKARELYRKNPEKSNSRNKEKREVRRTKLYEALGNECCKCGSTERLEIDHINPLYKESRLSLLSIGLESAMRQLDNLQLLCYDCHKARSTAQRKAAYKLLYALPVEEQERLIAESLVAE